MCLSGRFTPTGRGPYEPSQRHRKCVVVEETRLLGRMDLTSDILPTAPKQNGQSVTKNCAITTFAHTHFTNMEVQGIGTQAHRYMGRKTGVASETRQCVQRRVRWTIT